MATFEKSFQSPVSHRVRELAKKLERHIRASKLNPGDRYITAEEGGRLLGESVMSVQRAMSLLAKRHILERRPKAGTFIGEGAVDRMTIPKVHFLLPDQFIAEKGAQETYWSQIQGLRSVLSEVSIQFDFIPHQDMGFTRQVIEQATVGGHLLGVVLTLPSRAMRAWFNQSGIPTVVVGGVEADLTNLCWLNWDQRQIGRLLTQWLVQRGHRRLATIMRDVWSIGEHMLHDGVGEALSQAGLPANALLMRSAPPERSAIVELVRGLLGHGEDPPTGFICRTEFQAECVASVVNELSMTDQVDITLCNAPGHGAKSKFTSVLPVIGPVEQGRQIAMMLRGLTEAKPPEPRGWNVEVKLSEA